MPNKNMSRNWNDKLNYVYFISFVSFLMITELLSVSWAQGTLKSIGAAFFMMWGMANILYLFASGKIKFRGIEVFLLIFLLVSTLSSILNSQYGWIDNIKALIWMAIHYLLLFHINLYISDSKENTKKYFTINRLMAIPSIIWDSAILYSLFQFFGHTYYEIDHLGQGFNNGRLYGIFRDPNYASLATCCMAFLSLVCLERGKYKKFYRFNLCLFALYIMLCGSRGGWISFSIGILTFCIINKCYGKNRVIVNGNRIFKGFAKGMLMISVLFLVRGGFLKIAEQAYVQKVEVSSVSVEEGAETSSRTFERTDLEGHTLSNGRFDIWKSAVWIGMDHPLFGLAPRNLNNYADSNYPESYISITGQNAHSGYVGALVGTGFVGFGIVMLFFLLAAIQICPMTFARDENYREISAMIGLVASCIVGMVFIQDILIFNSISTVLFWTVLGNLKKMSDR